MAQDPRAALLVDSSPSVASPEQNAMAEVQLRAAPVLVSTLPTRGVA